MAPETAASATKPVAHMTSRTAFSARSAILHSRDAPLVCGAALPPGVPAAAPEGGVPIPTSPLSPSHRSVLGY
ncbi:MAG TPA: hypothetical protein VGP82_02170, partial [Ktedonobacterales bacterium]|nr:hypothetical protein [Ktedonobacterales bacterium]